MGNNINKNFTELLLFRIEASIMSAVKDHMEKIIETAKADIEAKLREEVDKIAINTLAQYDIYNDKDRLVITVKKDI